MNRFWDKVDKTDNCWNWVGGSRGRGYGAIKFRGKIWDTHRVSWVLAYGEIPIGLNVLHKCDNRRCVNPNHLYLGTQKDNVRDAINRGRFSFFDFTRFPHVVGERIGSAKLTSIKVLEIRKKWKTGKYSKRGLGREFKVAESVIRDLLKDPSNPTATWKHLWDSSSKEEHLVVNQKATVS